MGHGALSRGHQDSSPRAWLLVSPAHQLSSCSALPCSPGHLGHSPFSRPGSLHTGEGTEAAAPPMTLAHVSLVLPPCQLADASGGGGSWRPLLARGLRAVPWRGRQGPHGLVNPGGAGPWSLKCWLSQWTHMHGQCPAPRQHLQAQAGPNPDMWPLAALTQGCWRLPVPHVPTQLLSPGFRSGEAGRSLCWRLLCLAPPPSSVVPLRPPFSVRPLTFN